MKFIPILISFFILISVEVKAQNDTLSASDPIIRVIQGMDFTQYPGQPVDSFLTLLPTGYTLQIRGSITGKRAAYLVVKYAPSTAVYITVKNFTHMNPEFLNNNNPTAHWDINLFKQEIIAFIVAVNGSCFNGCGDLLKIN